MGLLVIGPNPIFVDLIENFKFQIQLELNEPDVGFNNLYGPFDPHDVFICLQALFVTQSRFETTYLDDIENFLLKVL